MCDNNTLDYLEDLLCEDNENIVIRYKCLKCSHIYDIKIGKK